MERYRVGDVIRWTRDGSVWCVTESPRELSRELWGICIDAGKSDWNRQYMNAPTHLTDSNSGWEFVEDGFTRWVRNVREQEAKATL